MPFPFTLPTTSSFSFSSSFESSSHPSLPLSASTYRGVLRDTLKKYKRLPPQSQAANLSSVLLSLESYIPYLLALDGGLSNQTVAGEEVDVVLQTTPTLEWRANISSSPVPGREPPRQKLNSLEYEIYFVLSTLAYTHTLYSRASLQPLYSSANSSPTPEQRTTYIQSATRSLLSAASVHNYLSTRSESLNSSPPCVDIYISTFRALSSLALGEATLLAVLKDDPYPAAVAQDRNKNDKEWMIKAPEIPKVRAHLFARLCLAASEHAAQASSLLSGGNSVKGGGRVNEELLKYVEDLRRAGRGKACRFFGIDAELGGETGKGIAWLRAGLQELGFAPTVSEDGGKKRGLGFSRFKKEWSEKREDRKVEKSTTWGADAGIAEEGRVLEMLETKWVKMNDTINTQHIPLPNSLLSSLPSGREVHAVKPFTPPPLDSSTLQAMRAPPTPPVDTDEDISKEGDEDSSTSDEEAREKTVKEKIVVGAFPGTKKDYDVIAGAGSSAYY